MRRSIIAIPTGPERPVTADPADVLQHGVAPRWRTVVVVSGDPRPTSPEGSVSVVVRLPRRLSATQRAPGWKDQLRQRRAARASRDPEATAARLAAGYPRSGPRYRPPPQGPAYPKEPRLSAEDVLRWLRGEPPAATRPPAPPTFATLRIVATSSQTESDWESEYPRCGLGLPKTLPARPVQRVPLTLRDLRQRAAEYRATDYRGENGVDIELDPQEVADILADPEYQRMASSERDNLPSRCFALVQGMRLFRRRTLADTYSASLRELGTAAGNALNEALRRRLFPAEPTDALRVELQQALSVAVPGATLGNLRAEDGALAGDVQIPPAPRQVLFRLQVGPQEGDG